MEQFNFYLLHNGFIKQKSVFPDVLFFLLPHNVFAFFCMAVTTVFFCTQDPTIEHGCSSAIRILLDFPAMYVR